MSYEDKTLNCVQCGKEFVFSAGEQAFYTEKGFASPPKRCKPCRKLRREGKSDDPTSYGDYRSPAFEKSAPDHQKIRQKHRRGRGRRGGGRGDQKPGQRANNRPPAARGRGGRKGPDEYRSPGFKDGQQFNPENEYRAPGFGEYQNIKPEEEYRAPGYKDGRDNWTDEKPMFSIVCSACGKEAMVPFLPEEKENPMCPDCFKLHQRMLAEEEQAAEAKAEEPSPEPDESTESEES
jgi:CxxC-x17-CxxC domain-containing protein